MHEFSSGSRLAAQAPRLTSYKRHRAEKKQDFSLFFRRRRNFSSLSVMATTLANRDLSIEWAFDFKSNRLLGDERISEGAQDSLKQ